MFHRVFLSALIAGAVAGLFAWGAHMAKTAPLILAAESYEVAEAADSSDDREWAPEEGVARHAFTLLANVVIAIGFGLVLVGAFALQGGEVDGWRGAVWGLAAFAAFHAAPALGLPPELPGMAAAPLGPRQLWWLATAAATGAGIALVAFGRRLGAMVLGAALIVAPHLVGAPAHDIQASPLPAELAARFAAASLVIAGLFWTLLGGLAGFVYRRLGPA